MKNADRPVYPLPLQAGESADSITTLSNVDGLTKREYFAAMAMQGMLANQYDPDLLPVRALKYADALLKELEK